MGLNPGCYAQMVVEAPCDDLEASPRSRKEKGEEIDLLASGDEDGDRVLEAS